MTLLAVTTMLQQHATNAKQAAETVRVYGQPPAGTIETSWLPHSIGGILSLVAAIFLITGLGSFGAMWRWLLKPVYDRIARESEQHSAAVTKEREERERAIEIATERRDRRFDEIVRPETGLLALVKKDLTLAINGVGSNVSTLVEERAMRDGRLRQLEDRMARSEDDRAQLHRAYGELKMNVEKLDDAVQQSRIDVIHEIQRSRDVTVGKIDEMGKRFTEVEKRVEVIDDRTKRSHGEVT